MAVPSSGPLALRGNIALEVYGTATGTNISLRTMSNIAGFAAPDTMSEFYGYSAYTAPLVQTWAATNITGTSMTVNGYFQRASVDSPGIIERGFYFGTNPNMLSNPRYTNVTWPGGNGFYMNTSGLNSSITYYMWAFVVDSVQETVGSVVSQATNAAFSPQFYTFNENASGLNMYRISGYIDVSLQYYNPDTGSYVQYGSYYTTRTTEYMGLNQMTKSGTTGVNCTNSRNLRYDRGTATSGTTRGSLGFTDCSHTSSYPNKYMTSRAWSFSSNGFSPALSLNVTNSYPGSSTWQAYHQNTTTFAVGSTLNLYYYFNYTTEPA